MNTTDTATETLTLDSETYVSGAFNAAYEQYAERTGTRPSISIRPSVSVAEGRGTDGTVRVIGYGTAAIAAAREILASL